ncbi:M1 family metallopeptidase [Flavobacteriaceae bacterium]|nr:M1 family metallopeptidase [Flavobacteriaceae bacterium]
MKKLLILAVLSISTLNAQRIYRYNDNGKTAKKDFDLIHTKLDLNLNFEDQTVLGEAKIVLKPHSVMVNKLQLDAKEMNIFDVKIKGKTVPFYNTGLKLNIDLPSEYTVNDTLSVFVKYKGNPNKVKGNGGVAITDNKGLYFINPTGEDPLKPTQVWTQGEPERNSVWFPTIDKPNQKTTEEIYLTVPSKYNTLSNGLLVNSIDNANGTRTDYWRQDLPHAPYLFFVGAGEFAVIKDNWRGKEVNYYVEPSYAENAKELFKNTPKMLSFFSELLGVEYPWDKYSQMIVRDYVSGAMENTTAVIHAEQAMLTKGQLLERNTWEPVIAHELFHHWFGDLVTTESWANITVNESFANYSEYLWLEHAYGKDRADEHLEKAKSQYLSKNVLADNYDKHLVRYNYSKHDDVFDLISYNKGGLILHMLRGYLGDDVFFKSLQYYLKKHQYKSAEAHDLRLAFEEVSGEDLLWFFSQWYYNNGHPRLRVSTFNNVVQNKVKLKITQTEKEYDFPIEVKVYQNNTVQTYTVFVDAKEKTFEFPYEKEPDYVHVNSNHVLLAEITEDGLKTDKQLIKQFEFAENYIDRLAVLELLKDKQSKNKKVYELFVDAIKDSSELVKIFALDHIDLSGSYAKKKTVKLITKIANSDNVNIKAAALGVMAKLVDRKYLSDFEKGLQNESPKVKGASLFGVYYIDKNRALELSESLSNEVKDVVYVPLLKMYLKEKRKTQTTFVAKYLLTGMYFIDDEKLKKEFKDSFDWLVSTDNKESIEVLVSDFVEKGNRYKKYNFNYECIRLLRKAIDVQMTSDNKNKTLLINIIENGIRELAVE